MALTRVHDKGRVRFLCMDCKADTYTNQQYYMLDDRLWWRLIAPGDGYGMLCLACAERRLGRALDRADFARARLNEQQARVCPELAERLARPPRLIRLEETALQTPSIEEARRSYLPDRVRLVLIAEAPPADPHRFFYFAKVRTRDALFLETIRALYTDATRAEVSTLRERKEELLMTFQRDGLFLLDACYDSMPTGASAAEKRLLICAGVPRLCRVLEAVCEADTPVILIAHPVYDAAAAKLRSNGFTVVNSGPIDFPAMGRAPHFRKQFPLALSAAGWKQRSSGVLRKGLEPSKRR